jgi:hypothetical protein
MAIYTSEIGVFSEEMVDIKHVELSGQQREDAESGPEKYIPHEAAQDANLHTEAGGDVVTAKTWAVILVSLTFSDPCFQQCSLIVRLYRSLSASPSGLYRTLAQSRVRSPPILGTQRPERGLQPRIQPPLLSLS